MNRARLWFDLAVAGLLLGLLGVLIVFGIKAEAETLKFSVGRYVPRERGGAFTFAERVGVPNDAVDHRHRSVGLDSVLPSMALEGKQSSLPLATSYPKSFHVSLNNIYLGKIWVSRKVFGYDHASTLLGNPCWRSPFVTGGERNDNIGEIAIGSLQSLLLGTSDAPVDIYHYPRALRIFQRFRAIPSGPGRVFSLYRLNQDSAESSPANKYQEKRQCNVQLIPAIFLHSDRRKLVDRYGWILVAGLLYLSFLFAGIGTWRLIYRLSWGCTCLVVGVVFDLLGGGLWLWHVS